MSRDLLFEIGVEELPSGYVAPALEQLATRVRAGLAELRLGSGALETFGTPRRLAVIAHDVAERQTDFSEEAMGPAAKVAFDAAGQPTRALLGFCAGKGVDVSAIRRVETPKGEYVAVTVHHPGQPAADVLPAMLARAANAITFPKTMRWDAGDYRFGRPVRWLVALLGGDVLPVEAFGLTAGRTSFGHRFLHPGTVEIAEPAAYVETMRKAFVMADVDARRAEIRRQLASVASLENGTLLEDPELLEINTFLVEWPTSIAGRFDPRFHELPNEVLITAMREHQRFFAIEIPGGHVAGSALLDKFISVRNGDNRGAATIRKGNEDVLVARLDDAIFYWETDLKHSPASLVEKLGSVVWMEGLGSLLDKARRLESLTGWLADRLAPGAKAAAQRAALLCKTDLLGEMIGSGKEYASLEGVIGGYYAQRAGEPQAACVAIGEHYRPRGAGDALPATDAGALLSLADKLDHVAGAFVAGKTPSGSEDPYGVRRAANGVVRILIEQSRTLDLRAAAMEMTRPLFAADPNLPHAGIMQKVGEFWRGRVDTALEEREVAYDTREAALEARIVIGGAVRPGWCDAVDALARAQALGAYRGDPQFTALVVLFKRVANILKAATEPLPTTLDRARLSEPAERALLGAFDAARERCEPLWERRAYADILPALLGMEQAIHGFFDAVMVNVDDATVRLNRLKLLADVRDLFLRGWDFSKIVVEGEHA